MVIGISRLRIVCQCQDCGVVGGVDQPLGGGKTDKQGDQGRDDGQVLHVSTNLLFMFMLMLMLATLGSFPE